MSSAFDKEAINELSNRVIGAAIEVHRIMGPGLLESVYEECLGHELSLRGATVATQVQTPLRYKDLELRASYRVDMLVDEHLLVEVKAVEKLAPIHEAQVLTYLRLTGLPLGLLLNFNVPVLRNGIQRLANGM